MNWAEVQIFTSTEGIEILCSALTDAGIKGFVIQDAEDFKEFLENKEGKWDYIDEDLMGLANCESSVTVYIPENEQGTEMIETLRTVVSNLKLSDTENIYGRLEISMKDVKEEDWANNWKQYFKPVKIGKKLVIKPSWEEYNGEDDRTILEIDPASSFGTGQHNTTRLCLELLEENLENATGRERVLDLGCGSGILSIGAILLGAGYACAVDIEQHSAETALENAEKNHISPDIYKTYCGNIIADEKLVEEIGSGYDIITANIVADVLIGMSGIFGKFLKDNGILIISGIISERKDEVTDAVTAKGFRIIKTHEKDGWCAVSLIKE